MYWDLCLCNGNFVYVMGTLSIQWELCLCTFSGNIINVLGSLCMYWDLCLCTGIFVYVMGTLSK